jgi:Chain length determinant protein
VPSPIVTCRGPKADVASRLPNAGCRRSDQGVASWPDAQPTWAPAPTDGTFLDLRDYGRVVARRWKLIAACVAVAIGLAVVWTISQTPIYTATAEILVKPPIGTTALGRTVQPFNSENERQIVDSLPVASLP